MNDEDHSTSHSKRPCQSSFCSMRRFTNRPKLSSLESLFETMFFASLKTEEAHELSFDIVYIDPENPDPNPPGRITKDRWCVTPLRRSITLTIPNLVKLARVPATLAALRLPFTMSPTDDCWRGSNGPGKRLQRFYELPNS